MDRKRILVLANSFKHQARCVAGREVNADGSLGPWIRPISNHGEGELLLHETRLAAGGQVEVLQRVEMPLVRHAADPFQPENWLIHGAGNWLDVSVKCATVPLAALVESPPNLWQEPGRFADCASHRWLQEAPPKQSLYLIRPKNLRIRVESRESKEKWRAVFQFKGVGYNFSITDPLFIHNHSPWMRGKTLPIEGQLRTAATIACSASASAACGRASTTSSRQPYSRTFHDGPGSIHNWPLEPRDGSVPRSVAAARDLAGGGCSLESL